MDIVLNTHFTRPLPSIPVPGFRDDFNTGHIPDSLGVTSREQRPWEYPGGGPWWQDSDGYARNNISGATRTPVVNGLASDGTITTMFGNINSTDKRVGITFRLQNADNYSWISANTSGMVTFYERFNGATDTNIASNSELNSGDTLSVQFIGSSITVQHNGSTIIQTSSARRIGATRHGMFAWSVDTNAQWDWVEFEPQ